ncbi:FUSC family protein [Kocuria sp. HSID16901]|uniref:FUSC family protein n=1 Tax=Kocuria sp. HSID16901 TaxID=2419505 RepID=UPI0006600E42|nr:FUSC family protein [Kocuria sp. HSID16901]RUQ20915.1 FUSC family protein [Kocuria sp. HSID16901]
MTDGHFRNIVSFAPSKADHIPATRIAVSVAVPLTTVVLLGRVDLAIFASFGAFTSLYARQETFIDRFRHQCMAGAILLGCLLVGLGLSHAHANPWVVIAAVALVGGVGASLALVLTLRPPGGLFFIFASGAVGAMHAPPPLLEGMATGLGAVVWSVLAGMLGYFLGEGRRGHVVPAPQHHGQPWNKIIQQGLLFFAAAGIAGVLGELSGISHSYWAMVAAVAPIAQPSVTARLYKCIQRIVGTFGGVMVTAFLLSSGLQQWHMVVWIVILQFLAEAFVMRNYGFAMLFVTPLALMMVQLAQPAPPEDILTARMAETAIGAAVSFVLVLIFRNQAERDADTQAIPILRRNHQRKQAS